MEPGSKTDIGHLNIADDAFNATNQNKCYIASRKSPKHQLSSSHGPHNAHLESLPIELMILILSSASDIWNLRLIAGCSPMYYKVYRDHRRIVLSKVLLRAIRFDILPDAFVLYKASQVETKKYESSRTWTINVRAFTTQYKVDRISRSLATSYDSLDMGMLQQLSRVQYMIDQISSDFCSTTLAIHPITGESDFPFKDINSNEKCRIQRAFYRYELFRALFMYLNTVPLDFGDRNRLESQDQNLLFLNLFQAWEREELACVHDYIINRHTRLLKDCSAEIDALLPRKDFADEMYEDSWRMRKMEQLIEYGLPYLCRALNAPSRTDRASVYEDRFHYNNGFFREALKDIPYDWIYDIELAQAIQDEQELFFEKDDLDGPNAAWPWSTGYKVCIDVLESDKHTLRKWAYVMWDKDRLDEWGVLDVDAEELKDKDAY